MARRKRTWYRRFGDMPGITWETPYGIDRTKLPGHDFKPRGADWDPDSDWWPMVGRPGGSSGAPPAAEHVGQDYPDTRSLQQILQQMAEALELPGYASTYHEVIYYSLEPMWKLRLREPRALREIERLGLLVLDLARRYPEIIERDEDEDDYYERQSHGHLGVCDTLYRLYLDQGYVADADRIIRQAIDEFGQTRYERGRGQAEITARRELWESEDA